MSSNNPHSILCDFLSELGVRHTAYYTDKAFATMTFKSLFGLCNLLRVYGVDTLAVKLADPKEVLSLPVPFLAQSRKGVFVIVTSCSEKGVSYLSEGQKESIDSSDFVHGINGIVLLASPRTDAAEPDYTKHRVREIATVARNVAFSAAVIFLIAYGFVANGVWRNWAMTVVTALTIGGIYVSWLLLQKTLNIRSRAADAVCGVIQRGGCDHVLASDASKFLGLVSWSEIGMGYFAVTLCVIVFSPSMWPWLAVCNCFCLPYAFWSIWYQKRRARHWCTLCLTVQALLWASFAFYLASGVFARVALPLNPFFILVTVYIAAICLLNITDCFILSRSPEQQEPQ